MPHCSNLIANALRLVSVDVIPREIGHTYTYDYGGAAAKRVLALDSEYPYIVLCSGLSPSRGLGSADGAQEQSTPSVPANATTWRLASAKLRCFFPRVWRASTLVGAPLRVFILHHTDTKNISIHHWHPPGRPKGGGGCTEQRHTVPPLTNDGRRPHTLLLFGPIFHRPSSLSFVGRVPHRRSVTTWTARYRG